MARKNDRRNTSEESTDLRIVGGKFRGRKLAYEPFGGVNSRVTRPMKHRTREAIFNLISTGSAGRHAIDLFAGTGALGLEALSRGAVGCTFIEKHVPTARIVEQNIAALGVTDVSKLLVTSAFLWGQRELTRGDGGAEDAATPWLVFCSPPYQFYVDRRDDMITLIRNLAARVPDDSLLVVEADDRFDFAELPGGIAESRKDAGWDIRTYSPAIVGLWHKQKSEAEQN